MNKPIFVPTYSTEFSAVRSIIKKFLPLLDQGNILRTLLKQGSGFSTRKPPTLASILSPSLPRSSSHQHWLTQRRFFKCRRNHCPCCKYVTKTNIVIDAISQERRYIKQFINCDSTCVVYHIRCEECNIVYVGCTIHKLKTRIQEHNMRLTLMPIIPLMFRNTSFYVMVVI